MRRGHLAPRATWPRAAQARGPARPRPFRAMVDLHALRRAIDALPPLDYPLHWLPPLDAPEDVIILRAERRRARAGAVRRILQSYLAECEAAAVAGEPPPDAAPFDEALAGVERRVRLPTTTIAAALRAGPEFPWRPAADPWLLSARPAAVRARV